MWLESMGLINMKGKFIHLQLKIILFSYSKCLQKVDLLFEGVSIHIGLVIGTKACLDGYILL